MLRRSLTPRHWRIAGVLCSLGVVLRGQGRLEEAATALEEARRIAEASLSAEHPLVATIAVERAHLHLDRHEAAAAEPLLRRALHVQRRTCPGDSWRTAATESLLAGALIELHRFDEAERLLENATAILPDVPGPRGRETAATRARVATLLARKALGSVSLSAGPSKIQP